MIPIVFLAIPFFLFFDVTLKSRKKSYPSGKLQKEEPKVQELEKKLKMLLEINQRKSAMEALHKDLQKSKSNTVAAYIKLNKEDIQGFHLFQLIFSLIKHGHEDERIIKILRHYLPSAPTTHLYAMLRSFKVFMNISQTDGVKKELLRDLNHNKVRTTLLYLERKLNQTLNLVPDTPPAMQQLVVDKAVVYGLVFAAFSEFYDNEATEKILRLADRLSPELFHYWHQKPRHVDVTTEGYARQLIQSSYGKFLN